MLSCDDPMCPMGSGDERAEIETTFDIRITLSDHTGSLTRCRLAGTIAETVLRCKVRFFTICFCCVSQKPTKFKIGCGISYNVRRKKVQTQMALPARKMRHQTIGVMPTRERSYYFYFKLRSCFAFRCKQNTFMLIILCSRCCYCYQFFF